MPLRTHAFLPDGASALTRLEQGRIHYATLRNGSGETFHYDLEKRGPVVKATIRNPFGRPLGTLRAELHSEQRLESQLDAAETLRITSTGQNPSYPAQVYRTALNALIDTGIANGLAVEAVRLPVKESLTGIVEERKAALTYLLP